MLFYDWVCQCTKQWNSTDSHNTCRHQIGHVRSLIDSWGTNHITQLILMNKWCILCKFIAPRDTSPSPNTTDIRLLMAYKYWHIRHWKIARSEKIQINSTRTQKETKVADFKAACKLKESRILQFGTRKLNGYVHLEKKTYGSQCDCSTGRLGVFQPTATHETKATLLSSLTITLGM